MIVRRVETAGLRKREREKKRESCLEETVQGNVYRKEEAGRNKTDFEDLVTQPSCQYYLVSEPT